MKFNSLVPELSVTHIEKSLDFYVNILGFTVVYQRKEEGFAYLSLEDAQIMIEELGRDREWQTGEYEYPLGRGINFEIEVDSISPHLDSLKQNNIKLFLKPEDKWYRKEDTEVGNRQFLVQDPDGYLLRFTENLGERPLQ